MVYFCIVFNLKITMQKKILSVLFSTRLMALLFLTYAGAMGIGTFIESYYNTATAKILIYDAWWFELILVFFLINFFGNIQRYQLYRKEKWATLLLHISFIFIIIGAAITRYISFEGMMPIRENASSNQIFSEKTYLTAFVDGEYKGQMKRRTFEKQLLMAQETSNNFSVAADFNETPFKIEYKNFLMDVKEGIKADKNGEFFLKLVESSDGSRHEHYLKAGEIQNIHNLLFSLNKYSQGAINITTDGTTTTINAPFDGQYMRMIDKFKGSLTNGKTDNLMFRSLYNVGNAQFVFPDQPVLGVKDYVSSGDYKAKKGNDALVVTVENNGIQKEVTLVGAQGKVGEPKVVKIGGLEYTLSYGSKTYELPFSIKLNDFIAKKYPGTEKSYSSYESKVTVIDNKKSFDAHIYMNNILDHQQFRFFQSSFDPDEKGTILSVNHDFWGTLVTYIGYFMLFFAMMCILVTKNTRFDDVKRKLEAVKLKKERLTLGLFLLFSVFGFSQERHLAQRPTFAQADSIIAKYKVPEIQASKFGRLVIQDDGGRMKPINTFSSELLRKVSKKDKYKDMNSDQAFLSMTQFPSYWFEIPIIVLTKENDSLHKILGLPKGDKYASFRSFFDDKGNYKLSPYLTDAAREKVKNKFQQDFIEADKKVNLLNSALSGSILKIFPIPNDKNNKWVSYLDLNHQTGTELDIIKLALPVYFDELLKGADSKNYLRANSMVSGLEDFQKKFGASVRPSDKKIDSEIFYNKYDIFKNLFWLYMLVGTFMLVFTIANIFFNNKIVRYVINFLHISVAFLFLLHTAGLIVRWYISGHAPWSDAYESMIYVAWATMFFTLAFDIKSKLTVASGTFVASMILMIAYSSWVDPAIANLQPVLNSYWLMIHVAVIVASYGPFTLGLVLGLVALLLVLCTNKKNKELMTLHIKEITYINELALTVGLVLLTIGMFLGGQWANESWGRYWGYDAKETWALISVMVYAFVIHARFVPALRGLFAFNFMAVLAYASVMMTYFGVNFHLAGLHSYASGEKQNVVIYAYITLGYLIFAAVCYVKFKKEYKK